MNFPRSCSPLVTRAQPGAYFTHLVWATCCFPQLPPVSVASVTALSAPESMAPGSDRAMEKPGRVEKESRGEMNFSGEAEQGQPGLEQGYRREMSATAPSVRPPPRHTHTYMAEVKQGVPPSQRSTRQGGFSPHTTPCTHAQVQQLYPTA